MTVGVFTESLHSKLTDEGGSVDISYTLDVNSNLSSFNELHITVKEAGVAECP